MKIAAIIRMAGSKRDSLYEGMGIILTRDLNKSTVNYIVLDLFSNYNHCAFLLNGFNSSCDKTPCGMSPTHK